jgi:uncharacterized membrane protein YkoI
VIEKKILISIVIVLLIGVAAASYQITSTTPGIWQPSVTQAQTSADQGSSGSTSESGITGTQPSSVSSSKSGTGNVNVKVLPSEAKETVQKNVLVPGFSTGTPNLTTLDGKLVYLVPILNGTKQTGEMYVDAQTGDILEGAGGVGNGSNG